MLQGHDPYAILTDEISKGATRAERMERGRRALLEAVALQACLWARGECLPNVPMDWPKKPKSEARSWLRSTKVGGGKWWIEKVLQADYYGLLERMKVKP